MLTPQLEIPSAPAVGVAEPFALGPPVASPAGGRAQTLRALHLINGEHYSGAERVQDLLAKQLPQFGYDVSFACLKPYRFPIARETTSAPLMEMPMRGRFDLRIVKRLVEQVEAQNYSLVHA